VDRCFDLLSAGVLGQVSPGACAQGREDAAVVGVGGQHEHPGGREALAELRGGGDPVGARHAQVHQDDVGPLCHGQPDRFLPVTRRAGDLHPVDEPDQHGQAVAHHPLVVGDQDTDGRPRAARGHAGTSSSTSQPPS
jgi:hypothetical protein